MYCALMVFGGPSGLPCAELRFDFEFSTRSPMGLTRDSPRKHKTNRSSTRKYPKGPPNTLWTPNFVYSEYELRSVLTLRNRELYAKAAKSDLSSEVRSPADRTKPTKYPNLAQSFDP